MPRPASAPSAPHITGSSSAPTIPSAPASSSIDASAPAPASVLFDRPTFADQHPVFHPGLPPAPAEAPAHQHEPWAPFDPSIEPPSLPEILSAFGRWLSVLGKYTVGRATTSTSSSMRADVPLARQAENTEVDASALMDTRAALPPLVAMLRHIPGVAGAPADSALALAQLMTESQQNRQMVFELQGVDALVAVLKLDESTPHTLDAASHALHMLVATPELCAGAAAAGAVPALCDLCDTRGKVLEGCTPAAGCLRKLVESSAEIRKLVRTARGCEALASLTLVTPESAPGTCRHAGYALLAMTTEEDHAVVDAVEKYCRDAQTWGKSMEYAHHATAHARLPHACPSHARLSHASRMPLACLSHAPHALVPAANAHTCGARVCVTRPVQG